MLMTRSQAEKWLDNSEGKQYSTTLCRFSVLRLRKCIFNAVTGARLTGLYAKNIPFDNEKVISKYAKVIKNYDSFLPRKLI